MEAANQAAASTKTEQAPGKEEGLEFQQEGGVGVMRSLSLGGGNGNKPKPTVTPANILQLQRMVGNQAVQRLLQQQNSTKNRPPSASVTPTAPVQVARDEENPYGPASEKRMEPTDDSYGPASQKRVVADEDFYVMKKVIQVTDLDTLDNIDENQNLPDEANEAEGEASDNNNVQGGEASDNNNASADPKGEVKYNNVAPLQNREKGEETGNSPIMENRRQGLLDQSIPENVNTKMRTRYITDRIERRAYRIFIEGGTFLNAEKKPLDSSEVFNLNKRGGAGFIFVMSRRGKMYAADMLGEYEKGGYDNDNKKVREGHTEVVAFHHSSFKAGKAVAGAGELVLSGGKLKVFTDASGHYQPTPANTLQVVKEFQSHGIDPNSYQLKIFALRNHGINEGAVSPAVFLQANGDLNETTRIVNSGEAPGQAEAPVQQQPQAIQGGGNDDEEISYGNANNNSAPVETETEETDPYQNQNASDNNNVPGQSSANSNSPAQSPANNNANPPGPVGNFKIAVMVYTSSASFGEMARKLITSLGIKQPVGHTWVNFTPKSGKEQSYGFYPTPTKAGQVLSPDDGYKNNDKTISYEYMVKQSQFVKALQYAIDTKTSPPNYELFGYNCTTFAMKVLETIGIAPPESSKLSIDNPNALSENIKYEADQNEHLGLEGPTLEKRGGK